MNPRDQKHEAEMRRLCASRGIKVFDGPRIHLLGNGVDIKFCEWRDVIALDLQPADPASRRGRDFQGVNR